VGVQGFAAALACAVLAWPLAAAADQAPEPAKPVEAPPIPATAQTPAAPATAPSTVPAGSVVDLEVAEPLSSKVVKLGDKFAIRLAAPIVKDGRVIAPAGTTGVGQVIDAAPAGMFGKPAKLLLAARYLDVGGGQIKLRTFQLGRVGVDNTNAVMAMSFIPYVGLASFLVRGGEIEVPIGARAQAKLAEDLPVPAAVPANPTTPSSEGPKQP